MSQLSFKSAHKVTVRRLNALFLKAGLNDVDVALTTVQQSDGPLQQVRATLRAPISEATRKRVGVTLRTACVAVGPCRVSEKEQRGGGCAGSKQTHERWMRQKLYYVNVAKNTDTGVELTPEEMASLEDAVNVNNRFGYISTALRMKSTCSEGDVAVNTIADVVAELPDEMIQGIKLILAEGFDRVSAEDIQTIIAAADYLQDDATLNAVGKTIDANVCKVICDSEHPDHGICAFLDRLFYNGVPMFATNSYNTDANIISEKIAWNIYAIQSQLTGGNRRSKSKTNKMGGAPYDRVAPALSESELLARGRHDTPALSVLELLYSRLSGMSVLHILAGYSEGEVASQMQDKLATDLICGAFDEVKNEVIHPAKFWHMFEGEHNANDFKQVFKRAPYGSCIFHNAKCVDLDDTLIIPHGVNVIGGPDNRLGRIDVVWSRHSNNYQMVLFNLNIVTLWFKTWTPAKGGTDVTKVNSCVISNSVNVYLTRYEGNANLIFTNNKIGRDGISDPFGTSHPIDIKFNQSPGRIKKMVGKLALIDNHIWGDLCHISLWNGVDELLMRGNTFHCGLKSDSGSDSERDLSSIVEVNIQHAELAIDEKRALIIKLKELNNRVECVPPVSSGGMLKKRSTPKRAKQ